MAQRRSLPFVSLLCWVLLLAACGGGDAPPDPPRDPSAAILLVDYSASLAPPSEQHALPDLTLLGDGTAVTRGPDQGVLLTGDRRSLTADEIDRLYRRAGAADLFDNRHFSLDILDGGALTVRITNGTTAYRTTVVQPSTDDGGDRGRIIAFAGAAMRAGTPAGPYRPTRAVVLVVAAGDDTSDVRPWPLPVPSSRLSGWPQRPCYLVEGTALAPVLDLARSAGPRSRWLTEGQRVALLVRPLLPHEHSCADLANAD
jgi:hypothetical protein